MRLSLPLTLLFLYTAGFIFANNYPQRYVTSANGLNIREKPDGKSQKIGFLRYLAKISIRNQSTEQSKIDGKTGHWYQVKVPGENATGWIFGGFTSEKMPKVSGKKIPLKHFLESDLEIVIGFTDVIQGLPENEINSHGFGYMRNSENGGGPPRDCHRPISRPQWVVGVECNSIDKFSYLENAVHIYVSGDGCKIGTESDAEVDSCPKDQLHSVRVECKVSRKQIEASIDISEKIDVESLWCRKL